MLRSILSWQRTKRDYKSGCQACPKGWRALVSSKLGQCRFCIRSALLGALAGWLAFLAVSLLVPIPFLKALSLPAPATAKVTSQLGIVQVLPGTTLPAIFTLNAGDLVFRTIASDPALGPILAGLAKFVKSYDRIAILYGAYPGNHNIVQALAQSFEAFGGTVTKPVVYVEYPAGPTDLTPYIYEAEEGNPDAVSLIPSSFPSPWAPEHLILPMTALGFTNSDRHGRLRLSLPDSGPLGRCP